MTFTARFTLAGGNRTPTRRGLFVMPPPWRPHTYCLFGRPRDRLRLCLGAAVRTASGVLPVKSSGSTTGKTLLTDVGAVDLLVPRDGSGSFELQIVRKGGDAAGGVQWSDHLRCMRGMTTAISTATCGEIYDVEVSLAIPDPGLISHFRAALGHLVHQRAPPRRPWSTRSGPG